MPVLGSDVKLSTSCSRLIGTLKVSDSLMCFDQGFGGSFQTVKVSNGLAAADQDRWGKHLPGGLDFWGGAGGEHLHLVVRFY